MSREHREQLAAARWDAIPDPTHNSLEAAILDQKVAGWMAGQDYAYAPIAMDQGFGVSIAIANQDGTTPVYGFRTFKHYDEAATFCDGMNKHIGLPMDHAVAIVCSTMGGMSYRRVA